MPRSRSFDETALLDTAIELFWVQGYHGTSLPELSAASGVANGSLYQAYGSKWGVFLAAFRRYCEKRVQTVATAVSGDHDDVTALLDHYFQEIVDDCLSHQDRRGCLLLNAISELGSDPEVASIASRTVDGMQDEVRTALARNTGRSREDHDIQVSADHAVALSQALIHLSRIGRAPDELRRTGHQAAVAARLTLTAA